MLYSVLVFLEVVQPLRDGLLQGQIIYSEMLLLCLCVQVSCVCLEVCPYMNRSDVSAPPDAIDYSLVAQSTIAAEGFDWDHVDGVLAKVDEEVAEIRSALTEHDLSHARQELGDLLLVAVNLARFLGADPRAELLQATKRLETRFDFVKKALESDGKILKTCSVDELEAYWQRVKPVADEVLKKRVDMGRDDEANSSSVLAENLVNKGQNEGVDNL